MVQVLELTENSRQFFAGWCQEILHARGQARKFRPSDEAKCPQLAQPFIQYLGGDAGDVRSNAPGRRTPAAMAATTPALHLHPTTSSSR